MPFCRVESFIMHLFCLCSVQCRCPANTAMRHQSFITQSLLCCAITKPRRDTVREHAFNSASVGHNHGPCSVCRESEVCRTGLHSLTSHTSLKEPIPDAGTQTQSRLCLARDHGQINTSPSISTREAAVSTSRLTNSRLPDDKDLS